MKISAGALVRGSWNNNTYQIMAKIGEGSFSEVFLVQSSLGEKLALKLSQHVRSITKEYQTLLQLNENNQLKKLKAIPDVVDTDDCTMADDLYRFIVLEYIDGKVLSWFWQNYQHFGEKELRQIGCSLVKILNCLHQQKLILGDLKPANIIYQKEEELRLVDLGGATEWGNVVEEYTPLFDRATWGMGTRIADPGYDIFSCCILLILLGSGNMWLKAEDGIMSLKEQIEGIPWSRQFKELIWTGLIGGYSSTKPFINELSLKKITGDSRKHYLQ